MGLFDRFKKDQTAAPDALTREAVARVRAVHGVLGVDVVDGDTLAVTWSGVDQPAAVSLAAIREPWTSASGFDRIEVMDDFIAALAPPAPGGGPSEAAMAPAPPVTEPAAAEPEPAQDAAPESDPGAAWEQARSQLVPSIGRPGAPDADTVHWPVAGVLEATAVLDGPVALPVGPAELAEWGVDADAVRAAAEANQAALDPALDPIGPGEPAWVPTQPPGRLASWLCAPDRLLAAAGLEHAVVLAPLASELVVVDPAAVELLRSVLASTRTIVQRQARTLWPAPFLVRAGSLEPWEPDADHPCAPLVAEMRELG